MMTCICKVDEVDIDDNYDIDGDNDFDFAAADVIHNCTIMLFGW